VVKCQARFNSVALCGEPLPDQKDLE
jgi:hypothetical protein